MVAAAMRSMPDATAISIVHRVIFSGYGNSANSIKPKTRLLIPTGSKKAWKLGIRLEIRWLSIIFTTPKVAALSMAKLIQFNGIGTHFK